MNKKTKKGLGYTFTLLVVGGITTGITVPVVQAKNKINDLRPFKNIKDTDALTAGLTVEEVKLLLEKAGISDDKLLNKTNEATASFLYEKEQAASIEMQKLDFYWQQYGKLLEIWAFVGKNFEGKTFTSLNGTTIDASEEKNEKISFIENNLIDETSGAEKALVDKYQTVFDNLDNFLNKETTGLITQMPTTTEKERDKKEALEKEWDNFEDAWEGIVENLNKIIDDDIPYSSNDFSSNFSTILLPTEQIREKQSKIYYDQKNSFVSSYGTEEEGLGKWETERLEKYNGATSDDAAIDYLLYTQIQTAAFKKYTYTIDASYTIEKVRSLIYKDIVGVDATQTAKMVKIDANHLEDDDLVYFISSGTKIIEEVNISGDLTDIDSESDKNYDSIANIIDARNLVQLQNAVFDIKQGTNNPRENWTIATDLLEKLFTIYNEQTLAADQMKNLFKGAEAADKNRDELLIARYSSTTDSTQWKSGNLGFMTALQTVGMVPAFGTGMTAALDIEYNNNILSADSSYQSVVEKPNFLSTLIDQIKTSFTTLLTGKGYDELVSAINAPSTGYYTNYNSDLRDAINNINTVNENVISSTVGKAIKDLFNGITVTGDTSGIAQILKIDDTNDTNDIYMVVTPEYGIHVIKINADIGGITEAMATDLAEVAKDQDVESSSTDYGTLFTDNYDRPNQINDLLNDSEDGEAYKTYLNEHIEDYEKVNTTIADDVQKMIDGLIEAGNQKRIEGIDPQKYIDYLVNSFDSDLLSMSYSADPRKLYEAIEKLATKGKN